MKKLLTLVAFPLCLSCVQPQKGFEEIPCTPTAQSENDNLRQVFKPCRQYIYQAKYWDHEYNLISNERIWMMATGQDWDAQPERQDEILIQFNYKEEELDRISNFSINKSIVRSWEQKMTEGIIEDGNETWMHPFRWNQYVFTEVAPFPLVEFPIEVGKTWTSTLNVHEGWGDWSDTRLNNSYEVISKDSLALSIGTLEAWHVQAVTTASFGNSSHDFWYNEQFGFVKMIIKNYKNQLLQFELSEIIEE